AVVPEDVREARGDHGFEPGILERPDGMLAAGAAAEVLTGDEDHRARVLGAVQDELGVLPPGVEEELSEAGSLHALQVLRRDDLIGVDVGAVERQRAADDRRDGLHQALPPAAASMPRSAGVAKCPAIAVAAATAGET